VSVSPLTLTTPSRFCQAAVADEWIWSKVLPVSSSAALCRACARPMNEVASRSSTVRPAKVA